MSGADAWLYMLWKAEESPYLVPLRQRASVLSPEGFDLLQEELIATLGSSERRLVMKTSAAKYHFRTGTLTDSLEAPIAAYRKWRHCLN